MFELNHPNSENTELNPNLLSVPFDVQTNWHVITGGPSSGKTTLINLMKEKGFQTIPEVARLYLQQEVTAGHSIAELEADLLKLQRAVVDYHLKFERGLNASEVLFLDRAFPDCLSYNRYVGINPNEILADCFHFHYASVFILDRLPFQPDGIRYEDEEIAEFLHQWILKDYIALGYEVVKVPITSTEKRLAFILKRLSDQGLI